MTRYHLQGEEKYVSWLIAAKEGETNNFRACVEHQKITGCSSCDDVLSTWIEPSCFHW